MLLFNITKRINKTVAPTFLSVSLRLHEYLSSSYSLPFSPNALSLLPLAQRLVSIEVQDDYRQLKYNADNNTKTKSAWENFVDDTWSLFFEDRHKRAQKAKQNRDDQMVEAEAQRLYEMKQQKRRKRQKQKKETRLRMNENEIIHINELASKSGEDRVQLLEQYIRPALCTDDYKNRHLFTHHYDEHRQSTSYDNFVKWIRGEYLIAKYGHIVQEAIQQYPTLRDDAAGLSTMEVEQTTMKKDTIVPLQLPSVDTIRKAFGMQDWTRYKVPVSTWEDDNVEVNANNENESASIQQIIHNKLHGQIAHSGPLNAFFEMRRREDSYELWTRDYIFGLAQYLHDRTIELDRNRTSPFHGETIILDVGAGDGRLAYFLRRAMSELQFENVPTIIATDDGSWNAPIYNNQYIQVEKLSVIESLKKYGPKRNDTHNDRDDAVPRRLIVLCSWMPPATDWTADFRQPVNDTKGGGTSKDDNDDDNGIEVERLVEEYILIGEVDDGTCGHNWYTWGNFDFHTEDDNEVLRSRKTPYEMDGYMRVDLKDLSLLQFSRFDCKRSSESMTVSFRHERRKS